MTRDYIYQNSRNLNKYIKVRRYTDGHTVIKQYIQTYVPGSYTRTVINYTGCSLKRAKLGTWHRVGKKTLEQILADYKRVA